ncbi:DUF4399 domain-containing protein [Hahella ganghwensis]|uniref:DUF4399 domain-containing protein n=1 Tax=Hahella ganghwensis TaxID=286420 RepID=UPI0003A1C80F|nr:DUF4399 domain-containing protein [Hahella ganghwensis]
MNTKVLYFAAGLSLTTLALPLTAFSATSVEEGAQYYIISPVDGATVSSPVTIQLGLQGLEEANAREKKLKAGHHHMLIDGKMPDMTQPMGGGVTYFDGKTQVSIKLTPGQHTLTLLLTDHFHQPNSPEVVADEITIMVE